MRTRWAPWLASMVLLVTTGCGVVLPDEPHSGATCVSLREGADGFDRLVLVTLDGVRWQEIERGVDTTLGPTLAPRDARTLLPHLYALIDRGLLLSGPLLATSPAAVSLPGYRELLTGRRQGCASNRCPALRDPTLLDELARHARLGEGEVALIGSWPGLLNAATVGGGALTLSAGRHGGLHRDRLRTDAQTSRLLDEAAARDGEPGEGDYRRDADTARLALAYLEARRPRFLHLALGDTDEYAHAGDYPSYLRSLEEADQVLGALDEALHRMGGRSVVLVTTDHGRSAAFAHHGGRDDGSERVWLVAGGGPVPARGRVELEEPRALADLAPTIRALWGLPADRSPRAGLPLPELLPAPTLVAALP